MTVWHQSLQNRFNSFSPAQQLLMVGNELNRAQHSQEDPAEYTRCLERALELLDLTIRSTRNKHLLREQLRIRHLLARMYLDPPQETQSLQKALIQLNPDAWQQVAPSFR